jgi:hypothetical protein
MENRKEFKTKEELFMKLLEQYEYAEETVIGEFSGNMEESRKWLDKEIEWYKSEWKRLEEVQDES